MCAGNTPAMRGGKLMDELDRSIINRMQEGFPVCERPYAQAARQLGIDEQVLIERLDRLLADGMLTRFGPMFNAERLGGALSLCAMGVPEGEFERVTELVNAYPEVAHNYAREHELNMWFVLATETPERVDAVLGEIEARTGYRVYNMPKLEEFFVELKFAV